MASLLGCWLVPKSLRFPHDWCYPRPFLTLAIGKGGVPSTGSYLCLATGGEYIFDPGPSILTDMGLLGLTRWPPRMVGTLHDFWERTFAKNVERWNQLTQKKCLLLGILEEIHIMMFVWYTFLSVARHLVILDPQWNPQIDHWSWRPTGVGHFIYSIKSRWPGRILAPNEAWVEVPSCLDCQAECTELIFRKANLEVTCLGYQYPACASLLNCCRSTNPQRVEQSLLTWTRLLHGSTETCHGIWSCLALRANVSGCAPVTRGLAPVNHVVLISPTLFQACVKNSEAKTVLDTWSENVAM